MTLAAAYLALIHLHSGQEDLAIGFPIAGRTRPELEPLIGFFVNTLVLRADLSGEPGFGALAGRVREAALGAWAHQDAPFEKLVEDLAPERDLSRSPLFQLLFSHQNVVAGGAGTIPGLDTRLEWIGTGTAKFDFSLFLRDLPESGELAGDVEYSADLFDAPSIRTLIRRFAALVEGAVASPETPLGDLPWLSAAEREQLLAVAVGVEAEYPREAPVHRVFEAVAARSPQAPAVVWESSEGETSLSYGELDRRANHLARRLRSLGVGPETAVALDMERSPELIVAMLAVLKAGGFYMPLDPSDVSGRRGWLLRDSGAAVRIRPEDVPRDAALPDGEEVSSELGGDALAYLLYTSGSTGRPKGVAVPHRGINRLVLNTDYIRLGPGDRIAHLSNTAFDVSTWEVWGPLMTGGATVIVPREVVLAPAVLGPALQRWRITGCFLTAALFNEVVREVPATLAGIRYLMAGGEALSPRWVREALAWMEPGCRLINGYGPTECTAYATWHDIESVPEGRSVPIGRPIANTLAYVLDRRLQTVPAGVAGEALPGRRRPGAGVFRAARPDGGPLRAESVRPGGRAALPHGRPGALAPR